MRVLFVCFALMLGTSAMRADIAPTPDAGPATANAAGLKFELQSVEVKYPPGYTKTFEVAVLTGCVERHPNCKLAHAKNLIGMEVESVDGESLRPEEGRLRQLAKAFAHAKKPVALELYRRTGGQSVTIGFAPH
jgi:hypothetical protein